MHLWLVKVSALSEHEYTFFVIKLFHENERWVFMSPNPSTLSILSQFLKCRGFAFLYSQYLLVCWIDIKYLLLSLSPVLYRMKHPSLNKIESIDTSILNQNNCFQRSSNSATIDTLILLLIQMPLLSLF